MDLLQTIQNIGLNQKEAKIYIALLILKEALPSMIAKKAGVKRPTTYVILEQLLQKGIVSTVKKGRYLYFQPINPHSLLETQYKRFEALREILPQMLTLHREYSIKPQMSFFEGKAGLIQIMEDTLTASTDLLCWADVTMATTTILGDYYPTYIKKKVKRNLWVRGIMSYDQMALEYKKRGTEELREIYLIPKKTFPLKNEINIYDDKIAVIAHADQVGVIIHNAAMAETQQSIFRFAFDYAKTIEQKILTEQDRKFLKFD